MHPEHVAHDHSAHARVSCVECHVGSGASWYVKSKMSGAAPGCKTDSEHLSASHRDACCRTCARPRKPASSATGRAASGEPNSRCSTTLAPTKPIRPRQVRLLIKTGGGDPNSGSEAAGIHWHMNIANKIEYRSDAKRQIMSWVRMTDRNGKVTEYTAAGADPAVVGKMEQRRMDCIDCHNRPTHVYTPPDRAVDQAMAARTHQSDAAVCQAAGRAGTDRRVQDQRSGDGCHRAGRSQPSTRRSIRSWPAAAPATFRTW